MLSFSNRDYDTILNDLKEQIPLLTDKWTDFNDSDLGMVFLKTLAGVTAMANFYIDKESNENFIGLAKESKNIESIIELIGFKKPLRKCAKATQVFSIAKGVDTFLDGNIVIPKYTEIFNKDKSICCVTANLISINPNQDIVEVPVYEGTFKSRTISNSNVSDYKFYLPTDTYADDNFELIVDDVVWTRVDNAFLEIDGGRKYSIHRDAYDSHYILFTHDYKQYMSLDGSMVINYISTNGEVVIAPREIINLGIVPTSVKGTNYSDIITTYNKDTFTGGFSEVDAYLERAKLQRKYHLFDKLVRLEDYEDYVATLEGVQDCEVSDISCKNTTNPKPYSIDIFILPTTGEFMSEAFKNNLIADLNKRQVLSNSFNIKDANILDIDIKLKYTTKASSHLIPTITSKIESVLAEHYNKISFRTPFICDELISIILKNVPEVYTVSLLNPSIDYYPSIGQIFRVASIDVQNEVYNYGL